MFLKLKIGVERNLFVPGPRIQGGASLIVVMMILVIVSLLGVAGAQIALMSERGARNDRDQQLAWQSAEVALLDAEIEMIDATTARHSLFDGRDTTSFIPGCGTSGLSIGLCAAVQSGKPAWLTADFMSVESTAPTAEFGQFTHRPFAAGGKGVQPEKKPRYVIELLPDPSGDKSSKSPPTYLYRVTAMGFGPRADTQAVLQMIYRN
jgi:type IV pilus assembly protein PilX